MKFLHLCIRVVDLEKSIKFYEDALGMKVLETKDNTEHGFVIVYMGYDNDDFKLELTYNIGTESYVVGDGYSHFAVSNDDIESLREEHIAKGYTVTKINSLPNGSSSYYFVTDPDGYRTEIIQSKNVN